MPLPDHINHLTILMPSWVGDVVMASCVWEMAKEKYPSTKLTAVIKPNLAPLLDGVDEFDDVLSLNIKSSVLSSAKQLKRIGSDAIILLPNSFRSALVAKLAAIKCRCGYKRDGRSWLLTDKIEIQKQNTPFPTRDYYLYLSNELFGMNKRNSKPSLGFVNTDKNILDDYSQPVVLIVAGASKPQKMWSTSNFAKVADELSDLGATCIAVGSPEEHDLVQELVSKAKSEVHDFTNKGITLGSLKNLVMASTLMITNDTGPRHIAVACGTPTITLYGPTDYRWTKYDCENDIAVLADPFLPENLVANSNPQRCNINNIPASDVIAIAKRFM
ncbi:MAG: lipopolysaccharide heptosyltransferase II [Phycisphaerales bacterium]|jgi:heptosyltransferase-2|nr:lipopolysaccharide heptosyltransferase II [Phycisphaerales bacterium]